MRPRVVVPAVFALLLMNPAAAALGALPGGEAEGAGTTPTSEALNGRLDVSASAHPGGGCEVRAAVNAVGILREDLPLNACSILTEAIAPLARVVGFAGRKLDNVDLDYLPLSHGHGQPTSVPGSSMMGAGAQSQGAGPASATQEEADTGLETEQAVESPILYDVHVSLAFAIDPLRCVADVAGTSHARLSARDASWADEAEIPPQTISTGALLSRVLPPSCGRALNAVTIPAAPGFPVPAETETTPAPGPSMQARDALAVLPLGIEAVLRAAHEDLPLEAPGEVAPGNTQAGGPDPLPTLRAEPIPADSESQGATGQVSTRAHDQGEGGRADADSSIAVAGVAQAETSFTLSARASPGRVDAHDPSMDESNRAAAPASITRAGFHQWDPASLLAARDTHGGDDARGEPSMAVAARASAPSARDANFLDADVGLPLPVLASALAAATLALAATALALYARISRSRLLDNPLRAHLHDLLRETPGLSAYQLAGQTGKHLTGIQHHLRKLRNAGLIVARDHAGIECFFLVGDARIAHTLAARESNAPRARLLAAITQHPGQSLEAAATRAEIPYTNARYHAKQLEAEGRIARERNGRAWRIFPASPASSPSHAGASPAGLPAACALALRN